MDPRSCQARRVAVPALAFVALACGCASSDYSEQGGVHTPVLVLDADFVRFENERMAFDRFLVLMRERARAAQGEPARLPSLHVSVAPGAPDVSARLTRMVEQLHRAGIREITLE